MVTPLPRMKKARIFERRFELKNTCVSGCSFSLQIHRFLQKICTAVLQPKISTGRYTIPMLFKKILTFFINFDVVWGGGLVRNSNHLTMTTVKSDNF